MREIRSLGFCAGGAGQPAFLPRHIGQIQAFDGLGSRFVVSQDPTPWGDPFSRRDPMAYPAPMACPPYEMPTHDSDC